MFEDMMDFVDKHYETPNDIYRTQQQATIDEVWEDTTLIQTVSEEIIHGLFEFEDIDAWVNSISEFTLSTIKDEKNYRRLMFHDMNHYIERGRYYLFDNNYWLCYDPTSHNEPFPEIMVRRCNNTLKWYDKETNTIKTLPCILEYEDSTPKPRITRDIITPSNGIVLIVQGNDDTIKFKENDRFIFNGRPFKITGYNNYMQQDILDEQIDLLFFDVYLDEIKPTDDLINGVADRYDYYEVKILNAPKTIIKDSTIELKAEVTTNGNSVDKDVEWTATNAEIDMFGNLIATGDVGSRISITATYGESFDVAYIDIVEEEVVDTYEILMTPIVENIKQTKSVEFNISLYKNGVATEDIIPVVYSGADNSNCYSVVDLGNNNHRLTNNKRSIKPLTIHATYEVSENSIIEFEQNIKLGAMY